MSISMAIFTFINVWWIALFAVLPFGVKAETSPSLTDYAAAPRAPQWKKLFALNTVISVAITLTLMLIINSHMFPLRDLLGDSL